MLRPPVAQDAVTLTPQGRGLLRPRRPWRDATRALRVEPSELLEQLAGATAGGAGLPGVVGASMRLPAPPARAVSAPAAGR